ncbi:DUF6510 family protein [Catenulispora yoronensis]
MPDERPPEPEPFADDLVVAFTEGDHEDGNALAGPLSEIFAVDVTTAVGRCAGCGTDGPIAQLHVYGPGPGLVARCPHCRQVVLRLVRGADAAWLDLRGAVSLRISVGE